MKLYGYAIIKVRNKDKSYSFRKISLSQEVEENQFNYVNIEDKPFYTNWSYLGNYYLPKKKINTVLTDVYNAINVMYLVYLLEPDAAKAMSLIKQTIQEELDDLYRKVNDKQDVLGVVCGSVCEIEDIDHLR